MEEINEFNGFGTVVNDGVMTAIHHATGITVQSESTEGDYGCADCHFCDNTDDADLTGACHSLPCCSTDWEDGCSRIWKKV